MSRCREVAGVLFEHACSAEAVSRCAGCGKPVCATHQRTRGERTLCIGCLRTTMADPAGRGSLAHLRDDPYFFWYYEDGGGLVDPYADEDYALFDSQESEFDAADDPEWHGS